jgi:hypothetical protein
MLLVSVGTVVASDKFTVDEKPILFRITPDEVAAYNLSVTNFEAVDRIYAIGLSSGDATNWIISPSMIKVSANSTASDVLNVFPKSTTSVGSYSLSIKIGYASEIEYLSLPINMNFEGFYTDFTPNVALTVTAPEVQDPRESMKVSVLMKNRNMLDMKNVTLRIRSELFSKEIETSLGPRKEKTNEFLFDIDKLQTPGVYKINVEVYYALTDKVISESETEFKIDTYSSITPKYESTKNWFIRQDIISLENLGNYERTKEISLVMPWYKRMFVTSDPKPEIIRVDGKSNLQWVPSLKPMEVKTITVTTNYRPLIIVVLLIIIAIVIYFMLRSPILLLKEAGVIEQDEHGISEIKVKLFIKNRSRKSFEQITITDKVPGITEFVESNNLGSMKPSRITKTTAKGTILHWDLDKLDSFEERIITYKLKSKLKIVGDMSLPKARAKFTCGIGKKEKFVISPNPLFLNRPK